MYGYRARIGYTSPPIVTETYAYEFYKMAPVGVTTVITTLMVARHTTGSGELEESWNHSLRAAREMARTGVDLIVLGGRPVVSSGGTKKAKEMIESLETELGVPVTTSSAAYRHAQEVLGSKLMGAIYYGAPAGNTEHLTRAENASSIPTKCAEIPFIDVGRVPSEVPFELAKELKQEHPEIDTISLGSPHWACAAIIDPVEQELQVNAIQGTQAILWHALRTLGIEDRVEGFGRLFRDF
jgi:maleate isomerase